MKIKHILIFIILSLLLISCDEGFDPYAEFLDRYTFTCILKSDTTFQLATLSKNYRPNGFDLYAFTEDPSIRGADIRVWYNDSVYVFRDSSVARTDSSRYTTPYHFYYNNKFQVGSRKSIELEVLLPTGKRLRAFSQTPGEIYFDNQSDVLVPPVGSNIVTFFWTPLTEGTFYVPEFSIRYRYNDNGNIIERTARIPKLLINRDDNLTPVFPNPSNAANIVYNQEAIDYAMEQISAGDNNKQNYSVYQSLIFDLIAFDLPASRYVSSTGGSVDDLTVTTNVSDYSNIDGGLGLFGSYNKKNYNRIKIFKDYVESFGYNYIPEN